jgi:3-keto-5-aminohexanoate cleavage enzyme
MRYANEGLFDRDRDNVWLLHGGGFGATPPGARNVLFNIDEGQRLFPRAIWGVTATGRDMFRIVTLGLSLGCDLVRVGFEDGIHLPDGSVARDNAQMVRAAVQIAALYGMQPASVAEARARFRI